MNTQEQTDDIMSDPKVKLLANSIVGLAEALETNVDDIIEELEVNFLHEPLRSYVIHYLESF